MRDVYFVYMCAWAAKIHGSSLPTVQGEEQSVAMALGVTHAANDRGEGPLHRYQVEALVVSMLAPQAK